MVSLEFRDGKKEVPDHVAALLTTIDTYLFTFEQAMAEAHKALLREHLNKIQARAVADHLTVFGR